MGLETFVACLHVGSDGKTVREQKQCIFVVRPARTVKGSRNHCDDMITRAVVTL